MFVGFVLAEGALRLLERMPGWKPYSALSSRLYESFHYHHLSDKREWSEERISPVLGWSDFKVAEFREKIRIEYLAGGSMKQSMVVSRNPKKTRILLFGDSFMFGWLVSAHETIDYYLQQILGDGYEVINLGVRGFGVDQIVLTALKYTELLNADIVILGFIEKDLHRSCHEFSSIAGAPKPRFNLLKQKLIYPEPIVSPRESYLRHQTIGAKFRDAFLATIYKSRFLGLLTQPFLMPSTNQCLGSLNTNILAEAITRLRTVPVIIFHLHGELPSVFVEATREDHVSYVSLPPQIDEIGAELGVKPEQHPDTHPKGSMNLVYAEAFRREIVRSILPK